jgi:DNA-binding beta-propeller fold protein YncE/mono/diheme cytochrome c family protein
MRSVVMMGVVGSAMGLAACSRGEMMQALQKQPPALGLERTAPPLLPASGDGTGSTIALVRLGERRIAVVADADAKVVRLLDTKTDQELPVTELDGAPSQLVVARDGRVFVAVRDHDEVEVLEQSPGGGAPLRVTARVATAVEPTALSLTPDGRTLLVTAGWGRALDAFATRTFEHRFRVPLAREPRAVVASDDGSAAYVAYASASLVSVVDLESPSHDVDAVALDRPDEIHEGQRIAWRQGYALARTEIGVFAPGVTALTGDTTERTETYGGVESTSMPAESFAVNVIHPHVRGGMGEADAAAAQMANAFAGGCLLPRAAAYDPRGQWLLVGCQGQDSVWRLDARTENRGAQVASWHVGGEPSGLALDEDQRQLYVWSQRTRTVSAVAVDSYHPSLFQPDTDDLVHVVALGPRVDMADAVAVGRDLFHKTSDPRISSDGRACASCHPDGRDDGLVWATPDGPRQTPTLAGRLAGTAPYGWNGARSTVKKHVTNTLVRLGGTGLDDVSIDALVAYCMTMAPPPKPALELASADPLVAEGRDLFESSSTGCASCHMSDGTFTDGNRHDVKSKAKGDPKRSFDTPSLRFVAGTAPYFHDGRYATLRALLVGSDRKMGHTRQLSPHELDALEAYLRTL